MPRYWVIAPYFAHLSEEWERIWDFDLQNRIISIGWSRLGDIRKYDKKQLNARVDRVYYRLTPGARTNYFKVVWSFYHDVKQGDLVIARRGRKIIAAVGTVTRTAYYDPKKIANIQLEHHFANHIGVRWHDVPRNKAFKQMVFGMQTLYGISEDRYTEFVESQNTLPQDLSATAEEDEASFPEGKEVYRVHRSRERDSKVVEVAKRARIIKDPLLRCEVCAFSFVERYGELGEGFIEAHHAVPLSQQLGEIETKAEDIALVCSNCHRMLHRRRPWLDMPELKKLMNSQDPA
jgi:hypothetical protein